MKLAVKRGLHEVRRTLRPPAAPVPVPERLHGRLRLFVLAGQSNMEGAGDPADYQPPARSIAERVFVFGADYRWRQAAEPLASPGVGPSVAFAAHLIGEDPDMAVGLIPAARGGTNIARWQPSLRDGDLYAEMLKRTRAAALLGNVEGLLFFQGENDAVGKPDDHPHDWAEWFSRFVDGVRRDIAPSLPIVFAQLGADTNDNPRWRAVQEQQAMVRLPNTSMIPTSDLAFARGSIHFTTPSYMEIGRRFADEFKRLTT